MPTRRTIFAGAAALSLGGLLLFGKADNALRALGVSPAPEVRDSDVRLVSNALADNNELLGLATALGATAAAALLSEQIVELGGKPAKASGKAAGTSPDKLATLIAATAAKRQADAARATSGELAQVLASMSAGLSQLATVEGTK